MSFISAKEIKEKLTIRDFLNKIGCRPTRTSGAESYYLSIFREEQTPSLTVNEHTGFWYDHGGSNASNIKGGSIIEMAMAYWHPVGLSEVLRKLTELFESELKTYTPVARLGGKVMVKNRNYEIDQFLPLGNTFGISSYLQSRCIWGVADGEVSELHYHVEANGRRKNFFAVGWQNEIGGWEVRNKYFKGCLGKKAMSFINKDSDALLVFEGYFDYLSYKYEHEEIDKNVLILNSLSFLDKAIERAAGYSSISLYFDHDLAGMTATEKFIRSHPSAKDNSSVYKGFKDYNDKVCHDLRKFIRENQKHQQPLFGNTFNHSRY